MRLKILILGAAMLAAASPAIAQDTAPPKDFTLNGTITGTSDYRLRGVSQSDTEPAIQGTMTITHKSGLYGGLFASNLAGWGTFGGPDLELDLIGGYKRPLGSGTIDVGLTWYMFPGGAPTTDFGELFARYTHAIGPASVTGGVYYAPPQRALGNYTNTPQSRIGDTEDNLYVTGDAAVGVPKTPFTLKAHLGYSLGNPGLGPNGTSVAPTGKYFDWAIGTDITYKIFTLNVSYLGTDITERNSAYLQPNFSRGQDGTGQIGNATVVVSLTASY